MKREYFGIIFITVFVGLVYLAKYFFNERVVMENLSKFVVIWVLIGFQVGQYSMRFPKAF